MAGPKAKTAKKANVVGDAPPPDVRIPAAVARAMEEKSAKRATAPARSARTLHLRVRRQDAFDRPETRRFEEFDVPRSTGMTVSDALDEIRRSPRTASGVTVAPPVWEASCLDGMCGACAMLVNGRVRMACGTRIDEVAPKDQKVTLEPLSKFPCERDLIVDRSRAFDALTQVKAWAAFDGTRAGGDAPRELPEARDARYPLTRCMTCAACLEACPEYGGSRPFIGAAALGQVELQNLHPLGAHGRTERLEAVMGEGGVTDCGKAQNCVDVCPQEIPLVDAIGAVARDTTKHLLFGWLFK